RLAGTDAETVNLTAQYLGFLVWLLPLMGANLVLCAALRGAGDVRFPLLATSVGLAVRFAAVTIGLQIGTSPSWLLTCMIVESACRNLVVIHRFRKGAWWDQLRVGSDARPATAGATS